MARQNYVLARHDFNKQAGAVRVNPSGAGTSSSRLVLGPPASATCWGCSLFLDLLASAPSKAQAGGIHPRQHIVARDPRGLPHQAAHVRGEGLWTVDQLMNLS